MAKDKIIDLPDLTEDEVCAYWRAQRTRYRSYVADQSCLRCAAPVTLASGWEIVNDRVLCAGCRRRLRDYWR